MQPFPDGAVLVVEDDPDVREVLVSILREEGYRVTEARNGHEALERLTRTSPFVILLDLMMPSMDGWTFREKQRSDPRWSSIPVVLISAHETPPATAAGLGVHSIQRKPIDIEVLLSTLAELAAPAGEGRL